MVSFTVDGLDNGQLSHLLDERYGILCRVGLHCAPAAHRTIGTFPQGSVRFGMGYFNTSEQISTATAALQELISERKLG